jgi:hypothetical protein
MGGRMTIEFYKVTEAINENGEPVLLWKFKDENGNLWNTETDINGTEMEAASIILGANQ